MSDRLIIERLGHHGDGIASGPVYVPYTLPDEEVTGTLDGQQLRDVKIAKPSPDRVKAPCRHFPSCGGCQLQHASDDFLVAWKTDIVRQALQAHGLNCQFLTTYVSSAGTRRRAVLAAKRTKKGALVGFHAKASDLVIDIPECQLLHPSLIAVRAAVEALARIGASRKQVLSVMVTYSDAGVDACVMNGKPLEPQMRIELAALAERFDLARLSWGDEPVVTRRPPRQTFGKAGVIPPSGAFLQATAEAQAVLQSDVREAVAGANRVVDLFSGCGTFALDLAAFHRVHAVEGDAAMIEALDQGWRGAQGLHAVSHEARDLFRRPLLPDELSRFDAAVLDPPRAGAEAQVAELCETRIPALAYVSCNPVSFARDAAKLVEAGYQLDHLRVVDQFRWSSHVELVAKLTLKTE